MKDLKDMGKIQRDLNNCITRGRLGLSMKVGDQVELTNGVTFRLSMIKSGREIRIAVVAPLEVKIYRTKAGYEEKPE